MNTKETILDNLTQYSPNQLAEFLEEETITWDEMRETGNLTPNLRKAIEEQQKNAEYNEWSSASSVDSIDAYKTYLQKYPSGKFADEARDRISDKDNEVNSIRVEDAWDSLDKNNVGTLRIFIRENPGNVHITEARTIINKLQKEKRRGNGTRLVISAIRDGYNSNRPDLKIPELLKTYLNANRITSTDIAQVIGEDNNIMEAEIVQTLCNEGIIEYDDLENISGIDEMFVDKLIDFQPSDVPDLPPAQPLESIKKDYTEVYFWGIPSSGKTCALGAIMSAAKNGTNVKAMHPDGNCQGAAYMMQLADLFEPEAVSVLPPRTDVQDTYEMRFTLVGEDGREHKLAFIDLSGELFTCMHLKASGLPFERQEQEDAINTLDNILIKNRTNNRKIHFFVVEYGAQDKKIRNMSQDSYLQAAISYIKEMDIFDEFTDGVYLIVTKVDKSKVDDSQLGAHLANYIDTYYKGLYGGLVDICEKKEINGGVVLRFPFSIGKVCFQNLCMFDKEWTHRIIEEIKDRSYAERAGIWGKLTRKFGK